MVPPELVGGAPFLAVVIDEGKSPPEWQALVSEWLVEAGCLYMVAWGETSSSWDDSVDFANMKHFGFDEIPNDKFVMTAWFSHDPLEEAFWFAKNTAVHPTIKLGRTVLVHISARDNESELLRKYADA
jgi:hypothetical protein